MAWLRLRRNWWTGDLARVFHFIGGPLDGSEKALPDPPDAFVYTEGEAGELHRYVLCGGLAEDQWFEYDGPADREEVVW